MDIRPRSLDDLPACVAALRRVHEADGYPAAWPEDPVGWLNPAKLVDARIAESDGAVIGHVGIGGNALSEAVHAVAHDLGALISVVRLFVVPSARRCGTGRDLLDAAVEMARLRGRRAVLDVEDGGVAAISLYERAGWQRIHSGPGDWTTPDGRAAFLHYYLSP
ncbi:GNAT family N-acetyltransferase [Nocardia sienata]|uniref:GNAT family N-acetyltransferase n=1 Tax=Nocardia sienata TaxID=248552 RepID=UPI001C3FB885|nr:GNAT family N-acetyltransferase [Nocardia sienata]